MCRYGYLDYKSHFACFSCRKAFKKTSITDWVKQKGLEKAYSDLRNAYGDVQAAKAEKRHGNTLSGISEEYLGSVSTCPQCGARMAAMGFDFRAPKMSAKEEWEIIEILYQNGFAFKGCGCSVGYEPPKRKSELEAFFKEHKQQSKGQKLLEKIERRTQQEG